jgi:hypothetical protein
MLRSVIRLIQDINAFKFEVKENLELYKLIIENHTGIDVSILLKNTKDIGRSETIEGTYYY